VSGYLAGGRSGVQDVGGREDLRGGVRMSGKRKRGAPHGASYES
jgi:hypothetical protein